MTQEAADEHDGCPAGRRERDSRRHERRHEGRGHRHPGRGRRPGQGVLHAPGVAAGPHAACRRPVHAARLGVLGPVRHHPHLGRARLGQGVPGRLRPPGHATGARRRRHRGERGLPSGPGRAGRRSGSRASQLLLARHVQRSGRQRLAAAGDHDPAARPCRGRRNVLRVCQRPGELAFRRAAAAHGEHEKRTGEADADWPDWYAAYMAAEQAGTELPT
jgi:hypothetical protein